MTFFNTIILLGVLQGTISFVLLWKANKNVTSNRLLAVLILLISLACFNIFLLELDIQIENLFWKFLLIILPLTIIMPLGPLVYYYIQSLGNPSFKLSQKEFRHFYPIILDLFPYLVYLISYLLLFSGFFNPDSIAVADHFVEVYDKYVDVPRWLSISIYLWFVFRMMQRIGVQNKSMKWAKQMFLGLLSFQITWFLFLILYLNPTTTEWLLSDAGWYPLYIPLTIMVYWFGIKGFLINANSRPKSTKAVPIEEVELNRSIHILNEAMTETKLYLNPSLSLSDVITHTQLSQKTISAVLNQYMGQSFNEYVNGFRVKAVKVKIADEQSQHLTLSGIAFSCGFNSQATFQRVFKTFTNQTPGQFAKSIKK